MSSSVRVHLRLDYTLQQTDVDLRQRHERHLAVNLLHPHIIITLAARQQIRIDDGL